IRAAARQSDFRAGGGGQAVIGESRRNATVVGAIFHDHVRAGRIVHLQRSSQRRVNLDDITAAKLNSSVLGNVEIGIALHEYFALESSSGRQLEVAAA